MPYSPPKLTINHIFTSPPMVAGKRMKIKSGRQADWRMHLPEHTHTHTEGQTI